MNTSTPITLALGLICATVALSGCVTPITLGPRHFGLGLFVDARYDDEDVDYLHVRGIGLLAADGRLSLGFADHEAVIARLDDRSYRFQTDRLFLAVGDAAEQTVPFRDDPAAD